MNFLSQWISLLDIVSQWRIVVVLANMRTVLGLTLSTLCASQSQYLGNRGMKINKFQVIFHYKFKDSLGYL